MLMHQFIMVVVATAKRFESVLLTVPATLRRAVSRVLEDSDLQET